MYEQRGGDGRHNIVTTAVWKDEGAFENAKEVVPEKLRAPGINPADTMKGLNVQIERGVYTRRLTDQIVRRRVLRRPMPSSRNVRRSQTYRRATVPEIGRV